MGNTIRVSSYKDPLVDTTRVEFAHSTFPSTVDLSPGNISIGTTGVGHRDSNNLFPAVKYLEDSRTPAGDIISREEILALVLRHCKELAQRTATATVTEAVVAVPAWYTSLDCKAARMAAAIAGFDAVQLVNEQVAAVVAYAYECGQFESGYTLVADLGAGAFNVAVVLVEGHQNTYNFVVSAIGGKNNLGGDAFANRLAEQVGKRTNLPSTRLKDACQQAIHSLANGNSYSIEVGDGPFKVTKEVFLDICQPLLQEIMDTIQGTLDSVHFSGDRLVSALLIGGASPTAGYKEAVAQVIGKGASVIHLFNRPELVAHGAAHIGYRRAIPTNVLHHTIQLQVKDQVLQIRQNESLPTSHEAEFQTSTDEHGSITINAYEVDGSNLLLLEEVSLGPFPSGRVKLQVIVSIDGDAAIEIRAIATIRKNTKLWTSPNFTVEELSKMRSVTDMRYSTMQGRGIGTDGS